MSSATRDRLEYWLNTIEELEQSSAAEMIADGYEAELGVVPFNVSHWNPSVQFRKKMIQSLRFEHESDPLSYIFSESLSCQDALLAKLGFDPNVNGCIIVPNGTIATLCVARWLNFARFRETVIICPNYFATLHQANLLEIRVAKRYMVRSTLGYELPVDMANPGQPIWVTNPVYCTGVHLKPSDVDRLRALLESGGVVIVDECLATAGNEIGPSLANSRGFIGIYSPHKSTSMNGLKFSLVVFDRCYTRFFQDWTDVLHGGLTVSSITAVKHFLSSNFLEYLGVYRAETDRTLEFLRRTVQRYSGAELDAGASGQFSTIYFPALPADFDADLGFLAEMMRITAAMIIPGRRSHFDPSIGACFRVNLTRDSVRFRTTLIRLLQYLTTSSVRDYFSSSDEG